MIIRALEHVSDSYVTLHPHPSCRYLLDNPEVSRGKRVLDLGSGCGASAIAAKLCSASHVVANDIDSGKMIITLVSCKVALNLHNTNSLPEDKC